MANTHSKPDNTKTPTPKTERRYKVGYVPNKGDTSTPAIQIKGKWLNEVGFTTNTPLTVRIMHGCLVITTEEAIITKQQQLLKQIQHTQQRISEAATASYQEKTQ